MLVIEDEEQIRRLLRLTLEEAGYGVRVAATGRAGLDETARAVPDAVILDLGLPDLSGVEVLVQLRERHAVPVLILSVFGQEGSKVQALDAGADDYLTKPFGDAELLARLRALLRRIKPAVATNAFRFGAVEVDFARRRVTRDGQPVKLTSMEYALLQLFVTHRDKALSHRQILRELWGPRAEAQTHYLRTYMMRLRKKLEDELDAPRFFLTESGVGYRFVSEPEAAR
ncbi:MAG TPA: response regulator transcription factor [Opitutus sp.]|nr:response regulator transcription factor [Opitutus sp.]